MRYWKGRIPIKIDGWNNFALLGGIKDFLFGTFNFYGCGITLEESIQDVIDGLRLRAEISLKRIAEGLDGDEYEDLAFRIVNHKGNLEDLFFIQYHECWEEKIKPRLGRYGRLERRVVKNQ